MAGIGSTPHETHMRARIDISEVDLRLQQLRLDEHVHRAAEHAVAEC
jgi:hypothetical protein